MRVRIIIGSSECDLNNIEPNWINEQINRRRNDGVPLCARVIIETDDINIFLATPGCPRSSGLSRRLTRAENEVISLR